MKHSVKTCKIYKRANMGGELVPVEAEAPEPVKSICTTMLGWIQRVIRAVEMEDERKLT